MPHPDTHLPAILTKASHCDTHTYIHTHTPAAVGAQAGGLLLLRELQRGCLRIGGGVSESAAQQAGAGNTAAAAAAAAVRSLAEKRGGHLCVCVCVCVCVCACAWSVKRCGLHGIPHQQYKLAVSLYLMWAINLWVGLKWGVGGGLL